MNIKKYISRFNLLTQRGRLGGGHAFALMRENKLFSAIYIAGTAVAIASAMVVALIIHIRISNIYPEVHRDRTVCIYGSFEDEDGKFLGYYYSPIAVEKVFNHLQCAEVVSANMALDNFYDFTVCAEMGKQEVPVTARFTDANFYRLYDFRFIDGRPYTDEHIQNADKCIVITNVLARKVFGTTEQVIGRQILLNYLPYRIIGIVKEVSPLLRDSSADVYMPYTVLDSRNHYRSGDVNYMGGLEVSVLLKKGCTYRMLVDELEPYRVKYLSMLKQTTGKEYKWFIKARPYWERSLNFFHSDDKTTIDMLCNLTMPGLLMLLLLLLPAINLSGLVSNRMESRVAEMGIRKAFGAKRRTLLNEVIHENLVLTLCGGIAGYLLSWLFISAIRNSAMFLTMFERDFDPVDNVTLQLDMFFTPTIFLIAFVCCVVLNLMAALIPAWSSLRKPIVESLNQKR
ncbi:MAG: ABC transporter permease [Bacteroidaceae bacterium]|nr:ABC transporter permease [Bacteroidaceae bacterium]